MNKTQTQNQGLYIMGLDPGTFRMGYGVIHTDLSEIKHIQSGVLESHKKNVGERLLDLNQQLTSIFKEHSIQHVAIEKTFLGKNPDSAFKIGQAFGMGCSEAYRWSCELFEYDVRYIKKAVTGAGGATKESVAYVVQNILQMEEGSFNHLDQSDALAVAICHVYAVQNQKALVIAGDPSC